MGKERQRGLLYRTKGSVRKTAHECCRHARVVKAERWGRVFSAFRMTSTSHHHDTQTSSAQTHLQHGPMKAGHYKAEISSTNATHHVRRG